MNLNRVTVTINTTARVNPKTTLAKTLYKIPRDLSKMVVAQNHDVKAERKVPDE
jgi:hypothetical protein